MPNKFLVLLFFLNSYSLLTGQIDTLLHYNYSTELATLGTKDYRQILTRFQLDQPIKLTGIRIHTSAKNGASFNLQVYGHEGGTNSPYTRKNLIPTTKVSKTKTDQETLEIELQEPIILDNDQCYISLDQFTDNFNLQIDTINTNDICRDKDGGIYYPTFLGSTLLGKNFLLPIELLVEYLPPTKPIFTEFTEQAQLAITMPIRSIAWADIDGDNWLDLLAGGQLYKNNKGTFKKISRRLPLAQRWQFGTSFFIDMDNDGDSDIICLGREVSYLFINDGTGNFKKTPLNLPPLQNPRAFSVADINQDQLPDLVVAQLWSKYPTPLPNYLFLNNGQLAFQDITERLYPNHKGDFNFPNTNRRSRGTQFTDYDLDGDVDLFISNYFLEEDEFYQNDGTGFFTKFNAPKELDPKNKNANHGTGVDWYDYDNDGDFDLLLPQLAHANYMELHGHKTTTLFKNNQGTFEPVKNTGIQFEETHSGAAFGDVNNDGLVDLITTAFYNCHYIDFYLQQKNQTFKMATYQAGLNKITSNTDACFVDFNNDGLLDVALGKDGKFSLFKNTQTNNNAWVKINLHSTSANHFGIGAIVKVYTDKNIYTQEVNAGRGQLMQKPATLHFGLSSAKKIKKIEVYWPNGKVQTYKKLKKNIHYLLKEGKKSGQMLSN